MSETMCPPFRAEHVGSLLRPERLLEVRQRAGIWGIGYAPAGGEITLDALHEVEDACIRDAVRFQEAVGLNAVTDGEMRRSSWAIDIIARIEGIEIRHPEAEYGMDFKGSGFRPPVPYTVGKLGRGPGGLVVDDYRYTSSLTCRTVKATLPAPSIIHFRGGRAAVDPAVYPDMEEFYADVGAVYRAELADLATAGCRYVQFDNVDTATLCDLAIRERKRAAGEDPDELVDIQGRLISSAAANRPEGMTVAMHLCRGNSQGNWMAEGGYEPVAERLFNAFDVDAFFLEYDTARAGDFGPLRYAPKDRFYVLGLVSTKVPQLESKDELKRRIEDAARFVPIEKICLSPQCGFASVSEGNPITPDDQRRKLDLVIETAAEVWGSA